MSAMAESARPCPGDGLQTLGAHLAQLPDEFALQAMQEVFGAALLGNWSAYADSHEKTYYANGCSGVRTWEHPADAVYKQVLTFIRWVEGDLPEASRDVREALIRQHMHQVYEQAKTGLADWSGPYECEQGEYFYNEGRDESTWKTPVDDWKDELALRHRVLTACLLPGPCGRGCTDSRTGPPTASTTDESSGNSVGLGLLRALAGIHRDDDGPDPSTPSSTSSYLSATSAWSPRSGRRSTRSAARSLRQRLAEQSVRSRRSIEPPPSADVVLAVEAVQLEEQEETHHQAAYSMHVDSETSVPAHLFKAFEMAGAAARDRGQHVLRVAGRGREQEQCLMIAAC